MPDGAPSSSHGITLAASAIPTTDEQLTTNDMAYAVKVAELTRDIDNRYAILALLLLEDIPMLVINSIILACVFVGYV